MFPRYNERRNQRRGLTLLELLIAISILAMVVGSLGALARGVQQGFEYTEGHGMATQHARVALDRIARTAGEATASEHFPGFIVVADEVGGWRFPDTLVVWRPNGAAADPDGLPRYNELVIYFPDRWSPNRLVETTVPWDWRTVPPVENEAQWRAEIAAIKHNPHAPRVTLTELLRRCPVPEDPGAPWRGAARFETRLRPSKGEWDQYRDGSLSWDDLAWVQGIYGAETGLRQAWLRIELQLIPGEEWVAIDPAAQRAIPFFGSAALYYEMHR